MHARRCGVLLFVFIIAIAGAQTTAELNEKAAQDLRTAETAKAKVLADLRKTLAPGQQKQLDKAETEWQEYRDQSLKLIAQQYEGGTAAGLFVTNAKVDLTVKRTDFLKTCFVEGYDETSAAAGDSIRPGSEQSFDGIVFCWVPPGTFRMGSVPYDQPDGDPDRIHDEIAHDVTISKGFWLGKYEVTQAQWKSVMGTNPSKFTGDDSLPVEQVSWDGCQAFIKRLNAGGSGDVYRLPTEAEWEYACRAGTKTPYYFGKTLSIEQASIQGGPEHTVKVGSYPANAWGLHDMHGNVEEWCQDWYGPYPSSAVSDPKGPAKGEQRISRGGAWYASSIHQRSAKRSGNAPDFQTYGTGFRLVRVER